MKKTFFYSIAIALTLALGFSSCSDDDDNTPQKQEQEQNQNTQNPSGENQNPSGENTTPEVVLVSELKCTVSEFETKYQTLKKDEPVSVTLTDVSNGNISKVSSVLKKMSGTSLQKAAEESKYIVSLVLESQDNSLTAIPVEAFKGCAVLKAIEIPESVTEIESKAFANCTALAEILANGVKTIAKDAFEGTSNNLKIEIPSSDPVVDDNKIVGVWQGTIMCCFDNSGSVIEQNNSSNNYFEFKTDGTFNYAYTNPTTNKVEFTDHGTWKIKDNQITIHWLGDDSYDDVHTFSILDSKLVFETNFENNPDSEFSKQVEEFQSIEKMPL